MNKDSRIYVAGHRGLAELGWRAQVSLEIGLQATYAWYRDSLNEPTLA